MIGAANQILNNYFIFSSENVNKISKDTDKTRELYMYMMLNILNQQKFESTFPHKHLLEYILLLADEKLSKYEILQTILNNRFLSKKQKDEYFTLFSMGQKISMAFGRLAFMRKYNKAKIGNTTDMMMNEIKKGDRGVVEVYQQGAVYLFRTSEVNKIVENSICDSEYMFAKPKPVKNPFNNIPFTKANLYTMYFGIEKMSVIKLPIIFYKYFLADFNLETFYKENQVMLRDKGIREYVENTEIDELYDDIFEMLDYTEVFARRKVNLDISKECCKCVIVKIMKPYLMLYFKHKNSLNKYESKESLYSLRRKLFELVEFNPHFGRKIHKQINPGLENKIAFKTYFNLNYPSNHVKFDKHEYKTSHLNTSFIHDDIYREHEDEVVIRTAPIFGPGYQSLQNAARAHLRFDDEDEDDSLIDSDDEVSENSHSSPRNGDSETEDGEIVEYNNNDDNENVSEVGFEIDRIGDLSLNEISNINDNSQETNDELTLEMLNEVIGCYSSLRERLENNEFDENPDSRENMNKNDE